MKGTYARDENSGPEKAGIPDLGSMERFMAYRKQHAHNLVYKGLGDFGAKVMRSTYT